MRSIEKKHKEPVEQPSPPSKKGLQSLEARIELCEEQIKALSKQEPITLDEIKSISQKLDLYIAKNLTLKNEFEQSLHKFKDINESLAKHDDWIRQLFSKIETLEKTPKQQPAQIIAKDCGFNPQTISEIRQKLSNVEQDLRTVN